MTKTFTKKDISRLVPIHWDGVDYYGLPLTENPIKNFYQTAFDKFIESKEGRELRLGIYKEEMEYWVELLQPIADFYKEYQEVNEAYFNHPYYEVAQEIARLNRVIQQSENKEMVKSAKESLVNKEIEKKKLNQDEFISLSEHRSALKYEFKELALEIFGEANNYPYSKFFKIPKHSIELIMTMYNDFKENKFEKHEKPNLHHSPKIERAVRASDNFNKISKQLIIDNYYLIRREK